MHSGTNRSYQLPTLHILIAEDSLAWYEELTSFLKARAEHWPMAAPSTKQVEFKFHPCCPTAQSFKETARELLKKNQRVFAALDLQMPITQDEDEDPQAGYNMTQWCLDHEKEQEWDHRQLKLCLMSKYGAKLDGINLEQKRTFQQRGITSIYKKATDPELEMKKAWDVIQAFILAQIRYCVFPVELQIGHTETQSLWFPGHEYQSRHLADLERISASTEGGLYLLFSDTEGYDVDWFHLCCHLRRVKGKVLDFRLIRPDNDPWEADLDDPGKALLIRRSNEAQINVREALRSHQLLRKASESGTDRLVFIQFPLFETVRNLEMLLSDDDRELLNDCVRILYDNDLDHLPRGINFILPENDNVLTFPSYEKILEPSGVIRDTISHYSSLRADKDKLEGVVLDPEIAAVMNKITGTERQGLDIMRTSIREAYNRVAGRKNRPKKYRIVVNDFSDIRPIARVFDSELGIRIRARWLFDDLNAKGVPRQPPSVSEDGAAALRALEEIHDDYVRLAAQMNLQKRLPDLKWAKADWEKFQALEKVFDFLQDLCDSPQKWRELISEFRPHADKPHWEDYFPSLLKRRSWPLDLPFSWPHEIRLHSAVIQYLEDSGVDFKIWADPDARIKEHDDLKEQWQLVEHKRRELAEEGNAREFARQSAFTFVREHHGQPVVALLVAPPGNAPPDLTRVIQSLIFFNAYVAICEAHTVFQKQEPPWEKKDLRAKLKSPEAGNSINLLCIYLQWLKNDKEERQRKSVFKNWCGEWLQDSKHADLLRLSGKLASGILKDFPDVDVLNEYHTNQLQRIIDLAKNKDRQSFSVEMALEMLGTIRNVYNKGNSKWLAFAADLLDFVRRFLAATSDPLLRIGWRGADEKVIHLWERSKPKLNIHRGEVWLFKTVKEDAHALFPIDDLIRLSEKCDSVWCYYTSGNVWLPLTAEAPDGRPQLVGNAKTPWLPDKDAVDDAKAGRGDRKTLTLWRSIYGS
jgi:hypothetical protein